MNTESRDPFGKLDELHRARRRVELRVQRNRDEKTGDRADERNPAHGTRLTVAAERERKQASNDRHPDSKRKIIRGHSGIYRTTHQVSNATTPMTIDSA